MGTITHRHHEEHLAITTSVGVIFAGQPPDLAGQAPPFIRRPGRWNLICTDRVRFDCRPPIGTQEQEDLLHGTAKAFHPRSLHPS